MVLPLKSENVAFDNKSNEDVNHNSFNLSERSKDISNFMVTRFKACTLLPNFGGLSLQPMEKIQMKRCHIQVSVIKPTTQDGPSLEFSNAAEWGVRGSPSHPKINLE